MKVEAILDRAVQGERLRREDLELLFESAPLLELGQAAHAVRERLVNPDEATYIIDRNINYTNVCVYRCRFCAFYRTAKDDDAYLLPLDEIVAKVAETVAAGGTGILLQGGVHPELRLDYYERLLRDLKATFPQVHLHAFSVPEIFFVAKVEKTAGPRGHPPPGGGGAGLDPGRRRRDPRGRHPAPHLVPGQGAHGGLARGPPRGAPTGTAHHRHHDVRGR